MRYRLWAAAAVMLGIALSGQAYGQVAAQAAAAAGNTAGGPEARSDVGKVANYTRLAEHQRGGLHFTGNVKVEGAAFPWDAIPVVVTCNGVVRYRTQADAKGNFKIEGSQAMPRAPMKANPHQEAASQLIGCDAEASVPGFKSSKLHIANVDIMDNPDIGTIVLRPDSSAAGTTESATTAGASKDAMKKFDKAREQWLGGNQNSAEHDLETAVKIDPGFAEAWYQLGKIQQNKKQDKKALESYQKAAAADAKFVPPYERIAELEALQKNWAEVAKASETALKLDPAGTPQLWYYAALGQYNTGRVDQAEASARKSIAMDPQHLAPKTEQLLAVILAGKGQLAEALEHLKNSLTYMKPGPTAELIKQQIVQVEKAMPPGAAK